MSAFSWARSPPSAPSRPMTGQEAAEAHERLAHLDLDLDSAAKARRAAKAQQKRAEPPSPLSGPSPIMSGPSPIMGGPMRGGGPAPKSRMSRMSNGAGVGGGALFGRRQARKTSVSAPADAPEPDSGYWSNDSDSNPQGGGGKVAHKPFVMQFRQYEGEEGVAPTHVLEAGKFEATPLPRGGGGAGGAAPVAHARFSKGGRGRRDAGGAGSRRASMSMPPPKQATVMLVDDEADDDGDGDGAMGGGAGPFCGVDMGHFVRWLSCMPIIKETAGMGEDQEEDDDDEADIVVARRPAPSPGGLDDCASP